MQVRVKHFLSKQIPKQLFPIFMLIWFYLFIIIPLTLKFCNIVECLTNLIVSHRFTESLIDRFSVLQHFADKLHGDFVEHSTMKEFHFVWRSDLQFVALKIDDKCVEMTLCCGQKLPQVADSEHWSHRVQNHLRARLEDRLWRGRWRCAASAAPTSGAWQAK